MCEKNYKYQFYEKELSETIDERYSFYYLLLYFDTFSYLKKVYSFCQVNSKSTK